MTCFEHPRVAIKLEFFHAVDGAQCTKPVPSVSVTKSAARKSRGWSQSALAAFAPAADAKGSSPQVPRRSHRAHGSTSARPAALRKDVAGKVVGQQEPFAPIGPAFVRRARNFVKPIRNALPVDHSLVAWHGPRRRCPDHNFRALKIGSATQP